MKAIKSIFVAIILLLSYCVNAQNDCHIYKMLVDTLYTTVNVFHINPHQKYPIDPIEPIIDTSKERIKIETAHVVYTHKKLSMLSAFDIKSWVAKEMKDRTLAKIKFTKADLLPNAEAVKNRISECLTFSPTPKQSKIEFRSVFDC